MVINENELILIRGLPGSGKSTMAGKITPNYFEADQFFMHNGVYDYQMEKIGEAHAWCQKKVKHAMIYGFNPVVVSNTFVKRWEMDAYLELASQHGYRITEITMSGPLHANVHGVPDEVIARMRSQWEK